MSQSNQAAMVFRGSAQLYVPVCAGIAFLVLSVFIMQNGHLHEDSYILFQYSRSLANGGGIAFDRLSGHSEGATDFLWMSALSFVHWASAKLIPIGVAAGVINAFGMSVLAYVVLRVRKEFDLFGVLLVGVLLVSGGAAAAAGGFSALAFGGLFAAMVCCCLERRALPTVLLAAAVSLFRPEGLLLVLGALVALFVTQDRKDRKRTAAYVLVAFVVPLSIFFFWRLSYFGMTLPLPLMVKQQTDSMLEGLTPNISSLRAFMPVLLCLFLFAKSIGRRNLLVIAGGSALLFVALLFAHQSQNIGYRFQFPVHVSIVLLCACAVPKLVGRWRYVCLLPLASIGWLLDPMSDDVVELTNSDYINSFPQILRESVDIESIAVTEAGRFPYWYDAPRMIDLVGLNSKNVVLNGPMQELEANSPEMIFLHHARRYSFDDAPSDPSVHYFVVDLEKIRLTDYDGRNPIDLAPAVALEYAEQHGYTGIAVEYGEDEERFLHVYFVSPKIDLEAFLLALDESFQTRTTYFSTRRPSK